jgi:hypothetical protein
MIDIDGVDSILKGLSWLDRFLAPLVLLAMILGVVIGRFAPNVDSVLNGAKFEGVSARKFGPSGDCPSHNSFGRRPACHDVADFNQR